MTRDTIPLDIEELNSIFTLDGDRLYRKSDNARWDGKDVTNQKTVRLSDGTKVHTPRVIYTLRYGKAPRGEILTNDYGELVDIDDNHFRMIIARRGDNIVKRKKECRKCFVGRFISKEGKRVAKAFKTLREASRWVNEGIYNNWKDMFDRYGFSI